MSGAEGETGEKILGGFAVMQLAFWGAFIRRGVLDALSLRS